MASTIYTGTASQTTAYATTDIYTLAIPTSSITNISQQGANVVISTGATALTITGVTLAQLATANFALQGGGNVIFGDGASDAIADQFGNTLTGTTNGDILVGLGGGDTINANNGANFIIGGAAVTDPNDGNDTITSGTGNDTIYGNGGNDQITSGGGQDLVYGGVGTDTIVTGALTGNTSIYGGGGFTDTVDGADTITIASSTGNLFVTGNAGNDTINITGSTGSASVYGGNGADTISLAASAGANLMAGGSSAGNTDADTITFTGTGAANVTIYGGVGVTDTNDGVDNITATLATGSAFIYGNAGNDIITLTTDGVASVYGGVGSDDILVNSATGATTAAVQIFGGPSTVGTTESISVAGLSAGAASTIFGGTGINDSADGADSITGGASNDLIYGNGGNDTILSGAGNDTMFGGAGNDSFLITGTGTKIVSDFGTGTDTLLINTTAVTGALSVSASSNAAQITFGTNVINETGTLPTPLTATLSADNVVDATDGQLIVQTASTAGSLVGSANADFIQGNVGNDVIVGAAGADTIVGGAGVDSMTGGAGNDIFRFAASGDTGVTVTTTDSITDFVAGGAGDKIAFAGFTGAPTVVAAGAAVNAADAAAANTALANTLTALADGQAQVVTFTGGAFTGTYLVLDGAGANDAVINITGVNGTVAAGDFI